MTGRQVQRKINSITAIALAIVLSLAVFPASGFEAQASDHTVITADTTAELVAAMNAANSSSGPVVIELAENQTYIVNDEDGFVINRFPAIFGSITIHGNGSTIAGDTYELGGNEYGRDGIFRVHTMGSLRLTDLTVTGGFREIGGGIRNSGNLVLENVLITGNSGCCGGAGGGIFNDGSTTLVSSSVSDNSAGGSASAAGIYNMGTVGSLTLIDSTVSDNEGGLGQDGYGVGIMSGGTLTLINSTVSGNSGAGVEVSGTATVVNSTIAGNQGAGIQNFGSLEITNSTISGNYGNGILTGSWGLGTTSLTGTLVANNGSSSGADIDGPVLDGGHNLLGDSSGSSGLTVGVNGNLLDVDPLLAELDDNGGPTKTVALLSDSPAINAIPASECEVDTDQRGVERPQGGACDIGAFEFSDSQSLQEILDQMDLDNGTERALVSLANQAEASLERGNETSACNQLQGFINSVDAQRGKKISDEQAGALISAALDARSEIDC